MALGTFNKAFNIMVLITLLAYCCSLFKSCLAGFCFCTFDMISKSWMITWRQKNWEKHLFASCDLNPMNLWPGLKNILKGSSRHLIFLILVFYFVFYFHYVANTLLLVPSLQVWQVGCQPYRETLFYHQHFYYPVGCNKPVEFPYPVYTNYEKLIIFWNTLCLSSQTLGTKDEISHQNFCQ